MSRLIVAGCVVASLLSACGSSSPKVAPNKVLSKSEFIDRANAICKSYHRRIDGVVGSARSGQTFEQAKKTLTETLIPLFRGELAELRALRPPKADVARVTKFTINLSQGINTIEGRVGAAKSMTELSAIVAPGLVRAKKAAQAYGITEC